MKQIVRVAVDKAAFHFDKLFSYTVPDGTPCPAPGCRVLVPFGRGNALRQALVMETGVEAGEKLKPLFAVVDDAPLLNEEMLGLVSWLKEHTFCTYYDVVKTILPSGLSQDIFCSYHLGDEAVAKEKEPKLAPYFARRSYARAEKLMEDLRLTKGEVERLVEEGALVKEQMARQKIGEDTIRMVGLADGFDERALEEKLTAKQQRVLDVLMEQGGLTLKELCYLAGVTQAVVQNLSKKKLLTFFDQVVYRNPYAVAAKEDREEVALSPGQQAVYDGLLSLYQSGQPQAALLYGVTGSGKTAVFLRLIKEVVEGGKQAILLVPEISLTPQMVGRFKAYFGDGVAVLHSGLSLGERMDEYRRIREGQAQIVVGTRSAVFAPCKKIGVIIMDEEQESSYKSDAAPRYHARDVAKYRCAKHGALLLFASATPSIETFYHAKSGRYALFTLKERWGSAQLPQVYILDMKDEIAEGNTSSFSLTLIEQLQDNLQSGHQSILLLNRRGYHTAVTCLNCGTTLTCPHCSISLTYHAVNGQLMCHYCGYTQDVGVPCPACGSTHLQYEGVGTQRAQRQLQELLPEARILRMDMDTTSARYSHDRYFEAFANGEYDILIGTQMVAKGLDFPGVTLVGVLSTDQCLYSGDFKSYEKAFALLTQVVGRCGRGEDEGRAFIQTMSPEHEVIHLAAEQDFDAFYEGEILSRKLLMLPPFCDMCALVFSSTSQAGASRAAQAFLRLLKEKAHASQKKIPLRVLGPTPLAILKVNNKYRYKLIVKCKDTYAYRELIRQTLAQFMGQKEQSRVTVTVDMNFEGNL